MPPFRHCIAFDQVIATDHPITGAIDLPASQGDAAVLRIERRPAVDPWPEPPPLWSFDQGVLAFHPPGVAQYWCTPSAITIEPIATAPAGMVEALLIATALPAVAWMQGAFVLHAAAIVAHGDDGALAIAGPSGSGKSRLASAFLTRRARLVADDSIAIRQQGQRPICAGLAGGYHLGAPDDAERPFHAVSSDHACRSAPLAAVTILDETVETAVRLDPVDAVAALLRNRHRPNVPRYCGLDAHALGCAAFLARQVPVYRWPRTAADALLDEEVRRTIMGAGEYR